MNTVNDQRQITLRSRVCSDIKYNKNTSFSLNSLWTLFSKVKDNLVNLYSIMKLNKNWLHPLNDLAPILQKPNLTT